MRTQTTRSVGGTSPANGAAAGPGYTVTRTAVGTYSVRFTPPLRGPIAGSATVNGSTQSSSTYTALITGYTDSGFIVYTSSANALTDLSFSFTAVGQA